MTVPTLNYNLGKNTSSLREWFFDNLILQDANKEVIALSFDCSHQHLQLGQEYIIFERHCFFDDLILQDAIKEVIALFFDCSHPQIQLGQEYIIFERHCFFDDFILQEAIKEVIALFFDCSHPHLQPTIKDAMALIFDL